MMKQVKLTLIPVSVILIAAAIIVYLLKTVPSASYKSQEMKSAAKEGTDDDPCARLHYEWQRLHDPATNSIPKNISVQEFNFIKKSMAVVNAPPLIADSAWVARGPCNVGGRTKALAIDIKNENNILAGCVSSGMWKSIDAGNSWEKTTNPEQLHSVSCIAQNKWPGKEKVWYYGTGEYSSGLGGSASGPLGTGAVYRGDGIFKSVDNGSSWSLLPSTISGSADISDSFDFIYKLATFGQDGILAATSCGVFVSTDGGVSWKHPLDFGKNYPSSDIAITSQGTFYAAVDGNGPDNGLYKSVDGEIWEDISPPDQPDTTTRSVFAIPPSNENIIFYLTEVAHWKQSFKKYEQGVGWTDLTMSLPYNAEMTTYGGNMLMLHIKPDDENTIFLGTVGLYRSVDGGQSFELIGGYSDFHVDQQSIAFLPSDPKIMIAGNDGGLFRTEDNTAEAKVDPKTGEYHIQWKSLNNGYVTTQFYTVAIDHGTPRSELILGGTQDNSWLFTQSSDPMTPWRAIMAGATDGGYCAVSDGGQYFYTGQGGTFTFWRHEYPNGVYQWTEITPASAIGMGLWMNPLLVDPHDTKIMYLPSRQELWRNSDLTGIPHIFPPVPTDVNWVKLQNVQPDFAISALGMSEAKPRRLYYGTNQGRIFRLDNPHQGQPTPVEVKGNNLQYYPYVYVHCLAVDPRNPDKLLVVFPNYGVISIFLSEDAGDNWTPVAGNLEENPDGFGSGPSVRWIATLYVKDTPVYLAGTSVGLFSTIRLNGMNTVWIREGTTTIGNVVVDMIDVRQSDGFVAVATHGNGVYSAHITKLPSVVRKNIARPDACTLFPAYPNPFNAITFIRFAIPYAGAVKITVYNILGEQVAVLLDERIQAGEHQIHWNAGTAASGPYIIRLNFDRFYKTQKVVLQR